MAAVEELSVAAAADVPTVYDVVIDGVGYLFDKRREDQALLGHTPTFVPRTNTSGVYGDNEQDFFLTLSQKDWSGGESQRFWGPDDDRKNRYWQGKGVVTDREGQISLMPIVKIPPSFPGGILAAIGDKASHWLTNLTNTYRYDPDGTLTSLGAHGAGTPCKYGMAIDGNAVYIAGSDVIRRLVGTMFTTFSTRINAGSLAFLNNQLYSCDNNTLRVYAMDGTPTELFTWKDAVGVNYPVSETTPQQPKLITYGSNLLIYWSRMGWQRPELWMYDGDATFRVAQLPIGQGGDAIESNGILFISSSEQGDLTTGANPSPTGVIYAWVNGSIQEVWREDIRSLWGSPPAPNWVPALGVLTGAIVFTSFYEGALNLKRYTLETGATETIGELQMTPVPTGSIKRLQISSSMGTVTVSGDQVYLQVFPGYPTDFQNGYLESSLYDFSSSLKKEFRGVTVDFEQWGGTATVGVQYRVDTLEGPSTILTTSITSGQEVLFPPATRGRTVQIILYLNNPVAYTTPIVKRVYVRAAPFQQAYRKAIYHLDLSGYQGLTPMMKRDGRPEPSTGYELAQKLYALVSAQTTVNVSDSIGSYTGVLDPEGFQITQHNPNEYIATVTIRQL